VHVRESAAMLGNQRVPFALVLFKPRDQTMLAGERLRVLRSQLVEGLARAGLDVGESPLMLGDQTLVCTLMLGA
jgi:hypothetical protein